MKFYICETCKNVITLLNDSGVTPMCCGKDVTELIANSVDATKEKHVPKVDIKDNEVMVQIGSDLHPMSDEHYIKFVVLETNKMTYIKHLKPSDNPTIKFKLCESEKPLNVYSYCNIHGLWSKQINEK